MIRYVFECVACVIQTFKYDGFSCIDFASNINYISFHSSKIEEMQTICDNKVKLQSIKK